MNDAPNMDTLLHYLDEDEQFNVWMNRLAEASGAFLDSPEVGLVALLPIGMAYVSSVNLTPEPGARLRKGGEFGYFLFGGSDIVMLFQDRNVVLNAEVGRKYLQGERLGQLD